MGGRTLFSSTKGPLHDQDTHAEHPPPPPYKDAPDTPELAASTMTTTVTTTTHTTQTTTHFFSLPLWRRRTLAGTLSTRPSTPQSFVDEVGFTRPNSLMLDKDLPAIPLSEESIEAATDTSSHRVSNDTHNLFFVPPSQAPSNLIPDLQHSAELNPHTQPARALAQAALGLGLPHVIPNASASSSVIIQPNSIPFITTAGPSFAPAKPSPDMRRAKSFSKNASARSSLDPSDAEHQQTGRHRVRGLSLMPLRSDGAQNSVQRKGKEADRDGDGFAAPPAQKATIARRASFWSRRRLHSMEPPRMPDPSSLRQLPQPSIAPDMHHPAPSLPLFQPVSPLNVDHHLQPTPHAAPPRSPGLQRRHSERSASHSSTSKMSPFEQSFSAFPSSMTPERSPNRPTHHRRPSSQGGERPRSMPLNAFAISSPPPVQQQLLGVPQLSLSSPRPRSITNPPRLLHRLSMGFFSSSTSFPVSSPTATTSGFSGKITSSATQSPVSSPRLSSSKSLSGIPKPRTDEESPELFVGRLEAAVSKAEIANVLASSADPFYARALQAYIDRFNFAKDPLDVALRKLLMDVGLPKETQQIDRVMESFAVAYEKCNTGLFVSNDHPYILAFSLIMLHTDAFNKSNRRKMTKPDYIKNTKLPGVPVEVLDCFFDNIVFAPFIFIEDPLDVNGQRGLVQDGQSSRFLPPPTGQAVNANGSGSVLGKGNKIDPYYLIANNMLDKLRVDVYSYIPLHNPYSYQGTAGSWDEDKLHRAFARPDVIEIDSMDSRRRSTLQLFSLGVGGAPGQIMQSFAPVPELTPGPYGYGYGTGEVGTLKVTKVGLLFRKEDLAEGGKKASSRKWKEWSVILTGSQLLFFRDPSWALNLIAQAESSSGQVLSPPMSLLKPDELLSMKDAIAVHDSTYTKYENTLRFVMASGRHFLLQAEDEQERNEWITHINYASAFKTAGIRMRAVSMSDKEVELTGMAAAASHLSEGRSKISGQHTIRQWSSSNPDVVINGDSHRSSSSSDVSMITSVSKRSRRSTTTSPEQMDLESAIIPPAESYQFKATFDEVKADLAAGRTSADDLGKTRTNGLQRVTARPSRQSTLTSENTDPGDLNSRSQIIRSKIRDLEVKIAGTQVRLDADLRIARNLAVLTPFQRASRERVRFAVMNLSKQVMQIRLDLIKMECHRDVLTADLGAEERDWQRSKQGALKAATESLESNKMLGVPQMTPSANWEQSGSLRLSPQPIHVLDHTDDPRPDSSACESFHSALDFDLDCLNSAASPSRFTPAVKSQTNFPAMTLLTNGSTAVSVNAYPFPVESPRQSLDIGNVSVSSDGFQTRDLDKSPLDDSISHDKFYTAQDAFDEQAEDWNKTRAAKRVSLVKLPADIRVSALMGRQGRNHGERFSGVHYPAALQDEDEVIAS